MPTYEAPTDKMRAAFEAARALPNNADRLAGVDIYLDQAKASRRDSDDEPRGAALSQYGFPVEQKVYIYKLQDRCGGSADVRVTLNGDVWGGLSKQNQVAACDRALTSIMVQMDDEDEPKLDDHGRPKLRLRKPDCLIAVFHEVAERHGKHSVEVNSLRAMINENGQAYMPWLDDASPTVAFATPARPKAPAKLGPGKVSYKRGPLKPKQLRQRLDHVKEPATWLAVAKLELDHKKPRKQVIEPLKDRVMTEARLPAWTAIANGQDPGLELDLAAAVLLTTPGLPEQKKLEVLVHECRDPAVLDGLIDEAEIEMQSEALDEAAKDLIENQVEVVRARIAELRTPLASAGEAANESVVVH